MFTLAVAGATFDEFIALHCPDRVSTGVFCNRVFMVVGLADTGLTDFFAVAHSISTFAVFTFFIKLPARKGGTNLGLGFLTTLVIVLFLNSLPFHAYC